MRRRVHATIQFVWLALLFLFSVPALSPLLTAIPTRSADGLLHLYRLVQLDALWRNSVFFSRWLPDLAYGYGMPLFNYYAPLVYYLTAPLHRIGISFPLALNLSFAAALFVGAVGMFWFARALYASLHREVLDAEMRPAHLAHPAEPAALVAAVAYLYSPYLLFNVLQRGNLAEAWALAFAPFALWRFCELTRKPNAWNGSLAAISFAVVMLSHNITSFLFAPLLLLFTLACIFSNTTRARRYTAILFSLSSFTAALALSAFFWLPALAEHDFVQIARVIVTPDFDYRFNFVPSRELVALLPRADTGRLNPSFPSTLGIVQAALALAGSIALAIAARTRRALPLFFLALAALAFTLLMLSISQPLWDQVSLLAFVQLPMRLRGLVALCLAPLVGVPFLLLRARGQIVAVSIAAAAIVLSAFPLLYPRSARDVPADPTLVDMQAYESRTGALGTTSFGEYLPVWVQEPPDKSPFTDAYAEDRLPDRFVIPESVDICGGGIYPTTQIVCASAAEPWNIVYRAFYFPGWVARVQGNVVEITPTPRTGLISFKVAEGGIVSVQYVGTEIENLATWISLLAALCICGAFAFALDQRLRASASRSGSPPLTLQYGALVPLVALALALLGFKVLYADRVSNVLVAHSDGTQIENISQARVETFGEALQLRGVDVSAQSVQRGDTLRTVLYWRALPNLQTNLSTFVHLTALDGFVIAQQDNLHPAHLPTAQWDPDAYAADEHAFEIPPDLVPGEYELRAGVYDPRTGARLTTTGSADFILLQKIIVK